MDVAKALETIAADAARGDLVFPSTAEIALRVQKALDDPDCSIDQLTKLISAEPILTARIVGIANSVSYNRSGRSSTDLRSAISRLGFKTLRVLATALVVRQMEAMSHSERQRQLARGLWEHTANVAALARVIAQKVTKIDPETAFFAGIVHEVGGFYLISRADRFPGLLDGDLSDWDGETEAQVGRAVLHVLGVPPDIIAALEVVWEGYLAMPPESLGDTLLLADQLSPVESPLGQLAGKGHKGMPSDIDIAIDDEMLSAILAESAEEVESLCSALRA